MTVSNQKSVTIGNVSANGATAATRGDVNITTNTNIQDASVQVGSVSSLNKDVTLKFVGQENLSVGAVTADDNSTGVKNFGKVNIDVTTSDNDATATFGNVRGVSVNLNVNNLKSLSVQSATATDGDVMINTGTNTYLETASFGFVSGKNVTMEVSNVTAPITGVTTVNVQNNLTINGYAGDDVSQFAITLQTPVDTTAKDFVANLTNVKGTINAVGGNSVIETMTIKGSITNPSSLKSAGQNSDLQVDASNLIALKSIDLSGYTNGSGKVELTTSAVSTDLTAIKGATTATQMNIYSTGLKTVEGGAGNDKVVFYAAQTKDIKVSLGAGNDDFVFDGTAALTANKKFEISGGAGNDTFDLSAVKTDATASKYTTITDINRGDKIKLGATAAFEKYTATDLDSEVSLSAAANKVLTHSNANVANKVWAFVYKSETYLVNDSDGNSTALSANDNLVKLAGLSHFDRFDASLYSGMLTVTNTNF